MLTRLLPGLHADMKEAQSVHALDRCETSGCSWKGVVVVTFRNGSEVAVQTNAYPCSVDAQNGARRLALKLAKLANR